MIFKAIKLRVVAITACFSAQDSLSKKSFSPQCNQALWI